MTVSEDAALPQHMAVSLGLTVTVTTDLAALPPSFEA